MNGHFTQKTPIKEVMESPVLNLTGGSFSPFIQAAGAVTPWKTSDSFGTVTSTPRRRQPLSMTFGSGRSKKETVFYDIYSVAEKAADPRKKDTGPFFLQRPEKGSFCRCERWRRLYLCGRHAR